MVLLNVYYQMWYYKIKHALCTCRQMQEPVSEPAQHQHRPVTRANIKPVDSSQHRSKLEVKSRAKQAEDALTPIHEFDEEGRLTKGSTSGSPDAKVSTKSSMRPYKPAQPQVCTLESYLSGVIVMRFYSEIIIVLYRVCKALWNVIL